MDENNEWYLLLQAHICIIGGKKEQARTLLESYNYNRFAIGKNVELSSYYLYLTTFLSNDTIGQRRVAEELAKSYMKHPDSWRILCMLINVDSEYKILSEKLRILEKIYNTRITYLCVAYKIYIDLNRSKKRSECANPHGYWFFQHF